MEKADFLCVGVITKPQGVKGELRLNVLMDRLSDIEKFSTLYVDGVAYEVEHFTKLNKGYAMKFKGVSSVEEAASMKNKEVYADKAMLDKLKNSGDFYIADLLNKVAVFEDGEVVGKIYDVANYGASDIVFIQSPKRPNLCFANVGGIILGVDGKEVKLCRAEFEKVCVSD